MRDANFGSGVCSTGWLSVSLVEPVAVDFGHLGGQILGVEVVELSLVLAADGVDRVGRGVQPGVLSEEQTAGGSIGTQGMVGSPDRELAFVAEVVASIS